MKTVTRRAARRAKRVVSWRGSRSWRAGRTVVGRAVARRG